ncbi:MAG TPA: mucoidy inhibitor MuiA family protein [Ktedonobacterales bacterium]|nr:mucoidy inhibitor MuiA family protein [Ktedonobacterales bacterium]
MQLTAPIAHITVFPDRALIQRRGSATLEAGTHSLVIGGLPETLDRDSVRASGSGPKGARIERLEVAPEYHAATPEAEVRALEEEIEDLRQQFQLLEARQQALANQQVWLNKLGEQSATDMARGLAFNRLKPEDCGAFFTFAADQARSLNEAKLDLDRQHIRLERDLQARQRQLNQLKGWRGSDRLAAAVEVTLPEAGLFALELSYVLPGASWTPQYDVRVDAEQRQVTLTYQGLVSQSTGEDWQQVDLTLSTARPSQATRVPELQPWYLQVVTPVVYPPARKARGFAFGGMAVPAAQPGAPLSAPAGAAMDFDVFAEPEEEKQAVAADVATTTVEQAGAALLFHTGHRADVPSDGAPHTIAIARDDLPCAFDYVTAPVIDLVAHLRATITNRTERVLLPGRAHIFHGEAYLGVTAIEKIAPNEEFKLFVGIDDSIRVKRDLEEKEVDKGTVLQTNLRRVTYTYRMKVRNYRQTPEQITLRDRLPVAQHERIKVRVLDIRPQPDERTKLDVLKWEFTLPPEQERVFDVRFSVEYPRDLNVTGLP